ncbi:hypothetical protein EJ04DRAFT_161466 [Polyplosphaeria fusca]|uniref:Uncharacterized protein n=1 Tax=Polyplosphaeria fusca TaxID=682080 RepID=A0A9P4V784_9PLEO|nr:hypothetical protein EJ04DRAFT_161466 [Polyplosphaeria fusca]
MADQRPASPPSRAVRMTRRQLAKHEEELSKSQRALAPPSEPEPEPESVAEELVEDAPSPEVVQVHPVEHLDAAPIAALPEQKSEEVHQLEETVVEAQEKVEEAHQSGEPIAEAQEQVVVNIEEPAAEDAIAGAQEQIEDQLTEQDVIDEEPTILAPEVEVTAEPKTLASAKPCEDESTPVTSRATSRTPSRSPGRSPMRLEESIEAIDALEEAIEKVGKAIPIFDTSADEKSPRKATFDQTPSARLKTGAVGKRSPLAAPKLSRNPAPAPKSLKPPAPAPRVSLARASSVRAPPSKDAAARKGPGDVTDYLASKRRPISMTFPAPPAPIRSTKAPTKSSFQLPGDAIAAKLKAQKEERLKREEEEEAATRAAFKARPVPKKPASVPVRQTTASKARENLMNGSTPVKHKDSKVKVVPKDTRTHNEIGCSIPPPPQPTARPLSTSFAPPKPRPRPSSVIIPPRQAALSTSTTLSRSSSSSNRNSMIVPGPVQKSTVTAADAAAQRLKAREIFNRDRIEKEARERERRDKEEAAKRARAAAAERGRIASREWAERQRLRKMGVAVPASRIVEAAGNVDKAIEAARAEAAKDAEVGEGHEAVVESA